jgi:hypothetical protein
MAIGALCSPLPSVGQVVGPEPLIRLHIAYDNDDPGRLPVVLEGGTFHLDPDRLASDEEASLLAEAVRLRWPVGGTLGVYELTSVVEGTLSAPLDRGELWTPTYAFESTVRESPPVPRSRRGAAMGLLIGGLAGAGLGILLGEACEGGECPRDRDVVLVTVGAGMLLGGLFGLASN